MESGTAGIPLRVAMPLGLSPAVIISLCTLLGGGGVLGRPRPIDDAGVSDMRDGVELDAEAEAEAVLGSSPPHGK